MPDAKRKFNGLSVDIVPMGVHLGLSNSQPIVEDEKDLEIVLLRQQLRIVKRRQPRGPAIPRWQKVPLAALAMGLKGKSQHAHQKLAESIILFKPETVIGWHRALVRRKWTFKQHRRTAGRPPDGGGHRGFSSPDSS